MPTVDIQWYYPAVGPGSVADIVSHLGGVQADLRSRAATFAGEAAVLLDTEPKRRTGQSQIKLDHGELDWYVTLTDPNGVGAAGGIEKRFHILARVTGAGGI
ncbi:DUF5403 family protein [Brevibacterium moorei]|uniref:DUF5403 family protein n=1 Tax=Brevibacterium moorei TaxID=2968457 RepID=UPI00211C2F55|nr:DUF5403 family protein [Brevibacterium sp. 68QC2CO]MCQ9385119.1 DUF5403 family protein [Brevibacterium sp. 68QC2CO]